MCVFCFTDTYPRIHQCLDSRGSGHLVNATYIHMKYILKDPAVSVSTFRFFLFLFLSKAGVPSLYLQARRDGPLPALAAGGAGLCAADAGRESRVQGFGVRGPPHRKGVCARHGDMRRFYRVLLCHSFPLLVGSEGGGQEVEPRPTQLRALGVCGHVGCLLSCFGHTRTEHRSRMFCPPRAFVF